MKTKIVKGIKDRRDALAIRVAKHYANISCPLITFQPEMPRAVKQLRKR